jgi:hypothetical protein
MIPSAGGFGSIFAGGTTGGILEWQPKTGIKVLAGTGLAGANGIEVSKTANGFMPHGVPGKWFGFRAGGSLEGRGKN